MTKYIQNEIKVITDPMESILSRPEMYIGKVSLYGLQCFIGGLRCASMAYNSIYNIKIDWREFDKWIRKTNNQKNNRSSFDMALEMSDNDDERAFHLWKQWYKDYISHALTF